MSSTHLECPWTDWLFTKLCGREFITFLPWRRYLYFHERHCWGQGIYNLLYHADSKSSQLWSGKTMTEQLPPPKAVSHHEHITHRGHVWPRQCLSYVKGNYTHFHNFHLSKCRSGRSVRPVSCRWWQLARRPVTTDQPQGHGLKLFLSHQTSWQSYPKRLSQWNRMDFGFSFSHSFLWPHLATQSLIPRSPRRQTKVPQNLLQIWRLEMASTSCPQGSPAEKEAGHTFAHPPRKSWIQPDYGYRPTVNNLKERWNTIKKLGTCRDGKHHVLAYFLFWSEPKANSNKWTMSGPNCVCSRHCSGKGGNLVTNR